MKQRTKESTRHVEAVLKALDILDCFEAQPALSLGQLIEGTGLNRSRVMRLAGTLESRGYMGLEADGGHYRLGFRLLTLGKASAAIGIAGPVNRLTPRTRAEALTAVRAAARELSLSLGWTSAERSPERHPGLHRGHRRTRT